MKHYRYLVIVALLITLLSAQFPTLAQNDAPLVLARVPLSAAAELPIYAELKDATGTAYALVRTSRAMLQSSAAPYQILDVASAETRYLVALERRPGARMQALALANVIYDDGRAGRDPGAGRRAERGRLRALLAAGSAARDDDPRPPGGDDDLFAAGRRDDRPSHAIGSL